MNHRKVSLFYFGTLRFLTILKLQILQLFNQAITTKFLLLKVHRPQHDKHLVSLIYSL